MADLEAIRRALFQMRQEATNARSAIEGAEELEPTQLKNAFVALQQSNFMLASIILDLMPQPQGPAQPQQPPHLEAERQAAINRLWTESHLKGANERSKFVVDIAVVTLRSVFLVNGAAIVALLTFLGTGRGPLESTMLRVAFQDFGIGLVLALLAMGLAYVTQQLFSLSEYDKAGAVYIAVIKNEPERAGAGNAPIAGALQIAAFFIAAGSLLFFILGSFASLDALFPNT